MFSFISPAAELLQLPVVVADQPLVILGEEVEDILRRSLQDAGSGSGETTPNLVGEGVVVFIYIYISFPHPISWASVASSCCSLFFNVHCVHPCLVDIAYEYIKGEKVRVY